MEAGRKTLPNRFEELAREADAALSGVELSSEELNDLLLRLFDWFQDRGIGTIANIADFTPETHELHDKWLQLGRRQRQVEIV